MCLIAAYCCTFDLSALTGTESRCLTTLSSMWTDATNSRGGQQVCGLVCLWIGVFHCQQHSVTAGAVQTAVHVMSLTQQHDTTLHQHLHFALAVAPTRYCQFPYHLPDFLCLSLFAATHRQAAAAHQQQHAADSAVPCQQPPQQPSQGQRVRLQSAALLHKHTWHAV